MTRRRWLPFDFDPQRPAGISATDAEHEAALARAEAVGAYLSEMGWPEPVMGDSGNGGHLLYRIDLPNDEASRDLVNRTLKALAAFTDDAEGQSCRVCLDTSVGNAGRIWKLYGTMAGKGDSVSDRPHRRAKLLSEPDVLEIVTPEQLEELCVALGMPKGAPQQQRAQSETGRKGPRHIEDFGGYLSQHSIRYTARDVGNVRKYLLDACVWNGHTDHSAWALQFPNGSIAVGCSHNSCQGKGLRELRDAVEPGWDSARSQSRQASSGAPNKRDREGQQQDEPPESPYRAYPYGLVWLKSTKDGTETVNLANFTAKIVADVTEDDGAETRRQFEIEATLNHRANRFAVPSDRFTGMGWATEHLGAMAIIYPGFTNKEHARTAVQILSGDIPERHTYTHTGWREIGGQWAYLHGAGAITADGTLLGVSVALPGDLAGFVLPDTPQGEMLKAAIQSSLTYLSAAPDRVSIPIYAAMLRAVLGEADCSVHVSGQTGEGKSELAALMQQHHGATMDARHLPASWSSTGNALEAVAFAAKDALLVVDDFNPSGSTSDIQRMHRDADRLLRAQGNHSGRQRMRSDATLRPAKPPRGLILSTGEDIPRGHSLRARMLVVELSPGDVNWGLLSACQKDAADGVYAQAFAGYVSWLALRHEERRRAIRAKVAELREKAAQSEMHRRTPEIVANLALGMETFIGFAQAIGALTTEGAQVLTRRTWAALGEVAKRQQQHQAASEPTRRFLELLNAAIASGKAHIQAPDGGKPGTDEQPWGWRLSTVGVGQTISYRWEPLGACIGWLDDTNLYLEPDAAYALVQQLGQTGGDGLGISGQTLWKRMHERKLLASTDQSRQTLKVRYQCAGQRRNVIHLTLETLSTYNPPDQPDHSPDDGGEGGENQEEWSGSTVGKSDQNENPTTNPTTVAAHEIRFPDAVVGLVGSDVGGERASFQSDARRRSGATEWPVLPHNPTTNPTTQPDHTADIDDLEEIA